MNDQEWKLYIQSEVSTIKADVKHILGSIDKIPICEKKLLKDKIKFNRFLIYFLMGIMIPPIIKTFIK